MSDKNEKREFQADVSQVLDSLEKSGIEYRVEEGSGGIMVPSSKVHDARMKLAAAGLPRAASASECPEPDRQVIVNEGEPETAFYIVAKGGVEVIKHDRVVGLMKQGDCFGEIAFLTRQPRNATIVARTEVSLMSVSASLMEQASTDTQIRYYRIFLENLIARLSQATDKLVEAELTITDDT